MVAQPGSAVAELRGLAEGDVARHDEDVSPMKLLAATAGPYLVRVDPHIAPDLRAPHRRARPVIVVEEECRVGRARRLGSHVCHTRGGEERMGRDSKLLLSDCHRLGFQGSSHAVRTDSFAERAVSRSGAALDAAGVRDLVE